MRLRKLTEYSDTKRQSQEGGASTPPPSRDVLHEAVLRTLLYYDLWQHPLTAPELYTLLQGPRLEFNEFISGLQSFGPGPRIATHRGYYYVDSHSKGIVSRRQEREAHARSLWKIAALSAAVIQRFPWVRGVFVSGDLSKNSSSPASDIDFFIVTAPGRLWITRTALILFKKTLLLNNKKYFCLNYFVSEDQLLSIDRSVFVATEIAHLKSMYNPDLLLSYFERNDWIREFFPNFSPQYLFAPPPRRRRSMLQQVTELACSILPLDVIDRGLCRMMERVWSRRYPHLDSSQRERLFRTTRSESRSFGQDVETSVVSIYRRRLEEHRIPA